MSLNVTDVLSDGARRAVATNGLMYVALLVPIAILNTVIAASLGASMRLELMMENPTVTHPFIQQIGTAVPSVALGLLYIIISLAGIAVSIAALRTFATDNTEYIPTDHITQNMGLSVANFFLASIIVSIAVFAGLILFIIPGIFVLISFWFFTMYVAVEDRNFYRALADSWAMARGHRIPLFLIGFGVTIVWLLIELLFLPLYALIGNGIMEGGLRTDILGSIPFALGTIYMYATTAQAYTRLKTLEQEDAEDTEDTAEAEDEETEDDTADEDVEADDDVEEDVEGDVEEAEDEEGEEEDAEGQSATEDDGSDAEQDEAEGRSG